MKIILASSSIQRQNIFNMIGLKYEVIVSDIDEVCKEIKPDKYVENLSLQKANAVLKKVIDKAIIIAADTILYKDGKMYEKPKNKEEAYNNIKELSNSMHSAYTGITIIDMYKEKSITFSSKADVYFKKIAEDEINWYILNEENIFKSCGYVPIGKAAIFIDKIDGDYNTLFGISPSIIFEKLYDLGYKITDFDFENYEK